MALEKYIASFNRPTYVPAWGTSPWLTKHDKESPAHRCNIFILIKKRKDLFGNDISGLEARFKVYGYSYFY